MHTALFRREEAEKEKVYALNTGIPKWHGTFVTVRKMVATWSHVVHKRLGYIFPARGVIARKYISFGFVDNH